MNYKIKFPNGNIKYFSNLHAIDAGNIIQDDSDNLCPNCKTRPVLKSSTLANKIGRYNPTWIEEDNIWYRFIDVHDVLCRGCRVHDSSVQNLRNWESNNPVEASKVWKENGNRIGNDYDIQAKAKLASSLNLHDNQILTNLYYAEVLEDDTVYKIGIAVNLDTRLHKSNTGFYKDKYTMSDIHKIKSGSNLELSNLEYNIKLKFGIRNFNLGTEFIYKNDLDKVIEFSNNYKFE